MINEEIYKKVMNEMEQRKSFDEDSIKIFLVRNGESDAGSKTKEIIERGRREGYIGKEGYLRILKREWLTEGKKQVIAVAIILFIINILLYI